MKCCNVSSSQIKRFETKVTCCPISHPSSPNSFLFIVFPTFCCCIWKCHDFFALCCYDMRWVLLLIFSSNGSNSFSFFSPQLPRWSTPPQHLAPVEQPWYPVGLTDCHLFPLSWFCILCWIVLPAGWLWKYHSPVQESQVLLLPV